ncbi:MAG: response regulator transcription factor, partial [Bacteroidota bacterium]
MKGPNTIYIASQSPLFILGIQQSLQRLPSFKIIGTSDSAIDSFEQITHLKPDIVLADIYLRDGLGIDMLETLVEKKTESKLCVLTGSLDENDFYKAMQIGLKGFLLFDISEDQLHFAFKEILKGATYICPSASKFIHKARELNEHEQIIHQKLDVLSKAEFRVLKQVLNKLSNREIASALFLSPKTIENHRNKIVKKLELKG